MAIVNLTPHPITLRTVEGVDTVISPSGVVARVSSTVGSLRTVEGLPVPVADSATYGEVIGLPDPSDGVFYIVSGLVLSRAFGREDVFGPGTGPQDGAIRNEVGQIIAVTRLNGAPKA